MRKLNTNDIIGQKFNKLTVLKYLYNKRTPHPCGKVDICHYYLCKCECGRIKQIERQALIKNRIKSCGILTSIDTETFKEPQFVCNDEYDYEHCEPVKPDDDIIYKGGDNE